MKDIDIIKEINLNSKVGMEGIDYCMDKTESVPFKAVLKAEAGVNTDFSWNILISLMVLLGTKPLRIRTTVSTSGSSGIFSPLRHTKYDQFLSQQ